jgi:hypothetical protein
VFVATGIRGDEAGVVEHHRERLQRLAERAARVALPGERRHELGDVARRELVDAAGAEQPTYPLDLERVPGLRVLGKVDAARLPPLGRLRDRRRRRGLGEQR